METLDGRTLNPYAGRFIHGVDLTNGYPCWNLSLSGQLFSPDFVAAVDPGVAACHKSIRDFDMALLEKGYTPQGAYTPRGVWFIEAAARIRMGDHERWKGQSAYHFSKNETNRILKMGDVELAFERDRRRIAPDAVSRLSCLYLAEDSETGRAHLKRMLGSNIHILRVAIPYALRVSKCDTGWFDAYWESGDRQYIENYWKGIPFDSNRPTWEFLVDGVIEADDPEGMKYLREHGVNIANPSA
ncbi:MAG: hypothetical protein ACFFCW_29220 [Candidatus Hodarchaeota archaeon]